MAIDVNWVTGVIFVPKSYMPIVQALPEARELDVDLFRHDLKNLEASAVGAIYSDTHAHKAESVLSGVLYIQEFKIIPPYTVEFEDGQYEVRPFGANHNLVAVRVANQVSITTQNSAGLQVVSGGGVAIADVQAGLTAQGYTAGRAPLLDSLDAAISSVVAPTSAEVADAVLDETAAAHVAAGSVGELLVGLAQLVAQQAAQIQTLQRERGLDPAVETKYGLEGSVGYIRAPADGSLLNIQISTTGSGATKVVTKRRL